MIIPYKSYRHPTTSCWDRHINGQTHESTNGKGNSQDGCHWEKKSFHPFDSPVTLILFASIPKSKSIHLMITKITPYKTINHRTTCSWGIMLLIISDGQPNITPPLLHAWGIKIVRIGNSLWYRGIKHFAMFCNRKIIKTPLWLITYLKCVCNCQ